MGGTEKVLSERDPFGTTAVILVTVGVYDLPFDRLVRAVDALVAFGAFTEEVFVQIGHSVAPTSPVQFERFLSFDRINKLADQASLIISQGGPDSIMLALARGKIPIVVPRQKQFGEMVDDHQILFAQKLAKEGKILPVYDICDLKAVCREYSKTTSRMKVSAHSVRKQANNFADRLGALLERHLEKQKL